MKYTGVFWSLTSAFLWSTTFVCARFLMRDRMIDPVSLSLIRFAAAGGILFLYGYFFMRTRLLAVTLRDVPGLAILSLFGVTGMSALLFLGQQSTTAINTSIIMQLNPVVIFFIGLGLGERASVRQFGGIILSLLGCGLVANMLTRTGFAYDFTHLTGDLLVFASACCWAIYSVFGKKTVQRLGGFSVTAWTMLFGAIELLAIFTLLPGERTMPATPASWSVIAYIAVFPTAVAFFAWFEAMNTIDLALLNVMQYLTPVFTILLAWVLLGERISLLNMIGIGIVMAGVMLVGAGGSRAPEAPARER